MRMRSVTAAAAASVVPMSTLVPMMRSPQDSPENGPSSTRRNHSSIVARSIDGCVYGKQRPIFIASPPGGSF
jgi:hypothetical protein